MKQAAAGAASATQAVKADKKPFFSQRTLSHFIDFLLVQHQYLFFHFIYFIIADFQ